MTRRRDEEGDANGQGGGIDPSALVAALRALPADELKSLLVASGAAPSTIGMTPENMQALMNTLHANSATAIREAIRSQRKENPAYPERSVFNPRGVFNDAGEAQAPKLKLSRPTFFNGVRLGGELESEEEIELCNRFTESRYAREGTWKAEVEGKGINQRLLITVPSRSVDDRMVLPPFTHILRELLDGAEAVNPESLQKQIAALQAEVAKLKAQPAQSAA